MDEAPLSISSANTILRPNRPGTSSSEERRVGILLPGGKAGLDVQGFAVSKGTQYPEKAYALAAFLSTRAETRGAFGVTSARQNLAGQTASTNDGPGGQGGPGGPGGPGSSFTAPGVQVLILRIYVQCPEALDEGIWNYLNRVELANVCCPNLERLQTELIRARERLRHKRHIIRSRPLWSFFLVAYTVLSSSFAHFLRIVSILFPILPLIFAWDWSLSPRLRGCLSPVW